METSNLRAAWSQLKIQACLESDDFSTIDSQYRSDYKLTKYTPYLTLMGDL